MSHPQSRVGDMAARYLEIDMPSFSIECQQFFDGDRDLRPCHVSCCQPVMLTEPDDSQNSIDADNANDQIDHTVKVDSVNRRPTERT